MAHGLGAHSPLTSYADGLGILPSAESLDHRSVYSLAFTGSTGTISSCISQNIEQGSDGTRGRSRTKVTMRTKEIEKSPLPHRFHLVPARKMTRPSQASVSPRPEAKEWKFKEHCGGASPDAGTYTAKSPSLYEVDNGVSPFSLSVRGVSGAYIWQSLSFEPVAHQRDKVKRTVIEDLVSDALASPVFESFSLHGDTLGDSAPSPHSISGSFTLVHEQSSRKSNRLSSSMFELLSSPILESFHNKAMEQEDVHAAPVEVGSASTLANISNADDALPDELSARSHDHDSHPLLLPSQNLDPPVEYNPYPPSSNQQPSRESVKQSDSTDSMSLQNSSLSIYSVHSSDCAEQVPPSESSHYSHSESTRSLSRRTTGGSFMSYGTPSMKDRRFAIRRQAIYAEYGFEITLPESNSRAALLRQQLRESAHARPPLPGDRATISPSVSRLRKGHTARSASEYAFSASAPRSAWSASTSGASLNSVIEAYTGTDAGDGYAHADLTYPSGSSSCMALNLAQANDKLERFSVQDELIALDRNPLFDTHAVLKTSTPPLSSKKSSSRTHSRQSLAQSLGRGVSPSVSTTAVDGGSLRRTCCSTSSLGSTVELKEDSVRMSCAPLQVVKRDSMDPLVLCVPVSPSDRAERFALWEEEPGHHPIVEVLLREVDKAIEDWRRPWSVVAGSRYM